MKKMIIFLTVLIMASFYSYSQTETKTNILFDGFYIAKTGSVPAANIEIFTYLRFYEDGIVILQAISSNDPKAVSKWFSRDKKFSQKGTYKIDGSKIIINVNNKESGDSRLEGPVETNYEGTINQSNQICLIRDKEADERCFVFSKIL